MYIPNHMPLSGLTRPPVDGMLAELRSNIDCLVMRRQSLYSNYSDCPYKGMNDAEYEDILFVEYPMAWVAVTDDRVTVSIKKEAKL